MNHVNIAIVCTIGLVGGVLLLLELGRRTGMRRLARYGENAVTGLSAIEGAVFALLGLLLAFTFAGAASRFDARRDLIRQEVNNIGTAYLRVDLLPESAQPHVRETFRRYVDSRIEMYRESARFLDSTAATAQTVELQSQLWKQAVDASESSPSPSTRLLLLPAINDVIDITTTRAVAASNHPPAIVFVMLLILVMASAFFAGHAMAAAGRHRDWPHMLCFAVVMSATVFVILDYEFPRLGLIRIDSFDQLLVDVRSSMK